MKKFSHPLILLALFALFNLFASGRWTWAAAAWLAALFGLRYLHTQPGRRSLLAFYLVSWLTLSISWYGATPIFGPAHFIFMAVNAFVGLLPFLADRWLLPRLQRENGLPFVATLIFPLAATAVEYLTVSSNPIGNFGATGYSQFGLLPLVQLTAVTGLLGLTFLINWTASTVNWAWSHQFRWVQVRGGLAIVGSLLLLVVGYGSIRLLTAPAPAAGETVPIAAFTLTEIDMGRLNELLASDPVAFRAETQAIHAAYLAETETAVSQGAKIILWPELAGVGLAADVDALLANGQALAQRHAIYLAMPTMALFPDSDRPAENILHIADPNGDIVLTHVKFGGNLLEGTLAGSGILQTVETPYGILSGVICWDTDFPNVLRQAGQQGVDILLSPSLEWAAINPMHAEMAAFRAVENGLTLVRQADKGLSLVVDAYGRVLAEADETTAGGNWLQTAVSTSSIPTLYPQVGDVVGLLSLPGLLLMAGWAFVAGRRRVQAGEKTAVLSS